jgi:ABC-type bacteriocin/lantibiotic exporter with double-glycine peptidase domain
MKPVIQQEKTGCAIACSAAISGISYMKAKQLANSIGITADNPALWSSTKPIRAILKKLGIKTGTHEIPFKTWESLPEIALLATKWHKEKNNAYWHWVVFVRENGKGIVLDSKRSLKTNIRTDFGRMKPRWFIKVNIQP